MPKSIIHTDHAPKAIGTYSQAVKVTGAQTILFLAGQVAYDDKGQPAHRGAEDRPAGGAVAAAGRSDDREQAVGLRSV